MDQIIFIDLAGFDALSAFIDSYLHLSVCELFIFVADYISF